MLAIVPVDVEGLLREAIQPFTDAKVMCKPLPQKLPSKSVCVVRTGGTRKEKVIDRSMVSFECRAKDLSDAMDLANDICGVVCALEDDERFNFASINALPYVSADPTHPDMARVSFMAYVGVRAETKEM